MQAGELLEGLLLDGELEGTDELLGLLDELLDDGVLELLDELLELLAGADVLNDAVALCPPPIA